MMSVSVTSVLAVAGNKCDLPTSPSLSAHSLLAWVESIHAVYTPTSAKTSSGVEALFLGIAARLGGEGMRKEAKFERSRLEHRKEASYKRSECCK